MDVKTDNNEYYCKKQIDNNNFTWTALLSTIEMTSKCPKLASGTTPPPQSCEQKTISRLFIVPYFSVLKILEKERYMQYSRPYYLLTPTPALRNIWNQLNQLQKRSATMSVWPRRPWGRRRALFKVRGTQRQFSEHICLEEDLRSRIFGTFVVKFLAYLLLLGFSNPPKMV